MSTAIPIVTTAVGAHSGKPVLLLGASLGTSSWALWQDCARSLQSSYDVVVWELPGHGGAPAAARAFDLSGLASGTLMAADQLMVGQARRVSTYFYAGVSIGGAVGLQLLLDAPHRVAAVAALCTGAKINEQQVWSERAVRVRREGMAPLISSSADKWFSPDFLERSPEISARLLHSLFTVDSEGYAQLCQALAGYDIRERLGQIDRPVLAVAGGADAPTPIAKLREIADGVQHGELVVLEGAGHLATVEQPEKVATLLAAFFGSTETGVGT